MIIDSRTVQYDREFFPITLAVDCEYRIFQVSANIVVSNITQTKQHSPTLRVKDITGKYRGCVKFIYLFEYILIYKNIVFEL